MLITLSLTLSISAIGSPATCESFDSPFHDAKRESYGALSQRMRSGFGDFRRSYIKGHKHAGVDIEGDNREAIFAMCPGEVADIHLGFPHLTVVIKHSMAKGEIIYTSYKHVTDVGIKVGDRVTTATKVGRLFSAKERRQAGWKLSHLHLEIRHSIDDGGEASWTSMTMEALRKYALDPRVFLRKRMQP